MVQVPQSATTIEAEMGNKYGTRTRTGMRPIAKQIPQLYKHKQYGLRAETK